MQKAKQSPRPSSLLLRPTELEKSESYILANFRNTKAKFGCTLAFHQETELTAALSNYPSVQLELFIGLTDNSCLAVLSIADRAAVRPLLLQPWFLKVDMTNVSLPPPAVIQQ